MEHMYARKLGSGHANPNLSPVHDRRRTLDLVKRIGTETADLIFLKQAQWTLLHGLKTPQAPCLSAS